MNELLHLSDMPVSIALAIAAFSLVVNALVKNNQQLLAYREKTEISEKELLNEINLLHKRITKYESALVCLEHDKDELSRRLCILEEKLMELGATKEDLKQWLV